MESDLHRHAHRDEHAELLQSTARGDRSHGDLRRLQRHRTPLHPRFSFTTALPHGASRRAAVIAAAYTALVGLFPSQQAALDARYEASLAALGDDGETAASRRASAASNGEPGSPRPCSPGARPMGSARATLHSPVGPRWASGGRRHPAFGAMSAQGLAFTAMFVLAEQHPVQARTTAEPGQRDVHGRFQRRQGARPQDRIDAHCGPDGARSVLGGERQRPLESGRQPDCARQPPVHVQEQPAARGPEHRDGRHGVHHLERQAILRRRSGRGDLAAGDVDPAGGHRRQPGHGARRGLAAARQHAFAPGVPGRAPQPQRCGGDRSPQPFPTTPRRSR